MVNLGKIAKYADIEATGECESTIFHITLSLYGGGKSSYRGDDLGWVDLSTGERVSPEEAIDLDEIIEEVTKTGTWSFRKVRVDLCSGHVEILRK